MLKKILLSAAVVAAFGYANQVNAQSCSGSMTVTIAGSVSGVPITASGLVTSNHNGSQISCNNATQGVINDGEITITASGGSTPYMYSIDNGTNYQTSNVFGTLTAGTYTFIVKDNKGCLKTTAVVTITAPDPISGGACPTLAEDLCQVDEGSVKIDAIGGTGALNSTWTAVANLPFTGTPGGSPAGNAPQLVVSPTGVTYTGLSGNSTYSFVVTDANGCKLQ